MRPSRVCDRLGHTDNLRRKFQKRSPRPPKRSKTCRNGRFSGPKRLPRMRTIREIVRVGGPRQYGNKSPGGNPAHGSERAGKLGRARPGRAGDLFRSRARVRATVDPADVEDLEGRGRGRVRPPLRPKVPPPNRVPAGDPVPASTLAPRQSSRRDPGGCALPILALRGRLSTTRSKRRLAANHRRARTPRRAPRVVRGPDHRP